LIHSNSLQAKGGNDLKVKGPCRGPEDNPKEKEAIEGRYLVQIQRRRLAHIASGQFRRKLNIRRKEA